MEAEAKAKSDALRMKKKLECDVNELEVGLDHANRVSSDLQKTVKKLQQAVLEHQSQVEDEQRQKNEMREAAATAERHAHSLVSEMEEHKLAVEQAERARRSAEAELKDAACQLSQVSSSLAGMVSHKKRLENDLAVLQGDLDDSFNEIQSANERANAASAENCRLAEELRHLRDHAASSDKAKRSLENQIKDLTSRLEDAEAVAAKGGKKLVQKLEQRVSFSFLVVLGVQSSHGRGRTLAGWPTELAGCDVCN